MGAVSDVFEEWQKRQRAPERCKLTAQRRKTIRTRLKDHSPNDLRLVIRYAYEADTAEAKFWRGDNADGREYLGLDNLFRAGKIDDRVERALEWEAGESTEDPWGITDADDASEYDEDEGPDLGPMGAFVRGVVAPVADKADKVIRSATKAARGRSPHRRW